MTQRLSLVFVFLRIVRCLIAAPNFLRNSFPFPDAEDRGLDDAGSLAELFGADESPFMVASPGARIHHIHIPMALPFDDIFSALSSGAGTVQESSDSMMPLMLDNGFSGAFSQSESKEYVREKGPDGKMHTTEVTTLCTKGNCTTTKKEVDSAAITPVFPDSLEELLGNLFNEGPSNAMNSPAVQTVKLRMQPTPQLSAPLEHIKNAEDGSEAIQGELPRGLDSTGLHVEQRGDVVLVRYSLNKTVEGRPIFGVEQQHRLGFIPEKKSKAFYDAATGQFKMTFPRPKDADSDSIVEIVFANAQPMAATSRSSTATAAFGSASRTNVEALKHPVILELGDEL